MMNKNDIVLALVGLSVGMSGFQEAVHAEDSTVVRSSNKIIEEVIVTAQKREQSAQDVPLSVTVLSGGALSASGIQSSEELQMVSPGLQTYRAGGNNSPYIRGIGSSGTTSGNEASVASYIDGYYMRDMAGTGRSFANVERVEVLNGPQGTLFGRNATGGVIQTVLKEPTFEQKTQLELFAGNYKTVGGNIYSSAALSENLAANIMVATQRQGEGYGRNLIVDEEVGFDEYTQVQSKFLYAASEDASVVLTFLWNDMESDKGLLRTCDKDSICPGDGVSPNFSDVRNNRNLAKENFSEGWLAGVRFDHSFDNFDFVSLSSYQTNDALQAQDVDNGPLDLVALRLNQLSKTFSQEFQVLSNSEGPLQWIAGLFFWDDSARYNPGIGFGDGFASVGGELNVRNELVTESIAIFGQIDYEIDENDAFTVGLRWTEDDKELKGFLALGPDGSSGSLPPYKADDSWSEATWRLAWNHQFSDDVMGYASYNRGFKSGGYNTFLTGGVPQEALEPEVLDAYALGLKGSFLDGRLRVNSELFRYDISDLQLRQFGASGPVYFNAAEGEIAGLELSVTTLLSDQFSATLNYAWLDAEYSEFPDCPVHTPSTTANNGLGGNDISLGDCTGNTMLTSPEYTVGLVLQHSVVTSFGAYDGTLTYYHNDGYFVGPEEGYEVDSYSLVNAELSWSIQDYKYSVALYANNITDEDVSTGSDVTNFGNMVAVGTLPREFGLKFRMNFN